MTFGFGLEGTFEIYWSVVVVFFHDLHSIAAYLFASAKPRDSMEINRRTAQKSHKGKASVEVSPESITSSIDFNYNDFFVPVTTPVKVQAPIPEEQQREIFQWMLEEKRKLKPKNPVEKKTNWRSKGHS